MKIYVMLFKNWKLLFKIVYQTLWIPNPKGKAQGNCWDRDQLHWVSFDEKKKNKTKTPLGSYQMHKN